MQGASHRCYHSSVNSSGLSKASGCAPTIPRSGPPRSLAPGSTPCSESQRASASTGGTALILFLHRSVTTLLIQHSPDFCDCDLKTVSDVVMRTLHEICVDPVVLKTDEVVFARHPTLFDCISVPVPQCAALILAEIGENLRAAIGRCCAVHAVPRLLSTSFRLQDIGIHVIAKQDAVAWQHLIGDELGVHNRSEEHRLSPVPTPGSPLPAGFLHYGDGPGGVAALYGSAQSRRANMPE